MSRNHHSDNWKTHRGDANLVATRGSKSQAQLPATAHLPEMAMRNGILTVLVVPLIAALTAQTVAASEYYHTRTKGHVVAIKQFRNSNAWAVPSYDAKQQYWSNLAEGAQTSGIAGH
jgi:hypothetical protein